MMKFLVFLLTGIVYLIPSYALAQQNDKLLYYNSLKIETSPIKYKSPSGAMLRSAILPGWGQLYNNKYLKALVYLGGESYFVSRYAAIDKDVKKLKNDESLNATKDQIEKKEHLRNGWVWLFGAGYLLALGDAYVDAHLYGLGNDKKLSFVLRTDDRSRSLQMQLNLTF